MRDSVRVFESTYLQSAPAELADAWGLERIAWIVPAACVAPFDAAPGTVLVTGWWFHERMHNPQPLLPNPWDERTALAPHERYCWEASGHLLSALANRLNALHDTSHSLAYWDLLLRPWMLETFSVIVDRRLQCLAAARAAPEAEFLVRPEADPSRLMQDSTFAYVSDDGNLDLIGHVVKELGLPVAEVASNAAAIHGRPAPPSFPARALAKLRQPSAAVELAGALGAVLALGGARGRRALLLGNCHLSGPQALRLARQVKGMRVGQRRELRRREWLGPVVPDLEARRSLGELPGRDATEVLAARLLPELLPLSVVEGYERLISESRRVYGRECAVVHGGYSSNELRNEFCARCREAGRPIAFYQHGGGYRQFRVNPVERLELRPDAVFVSWGWRGPGARPTPSPHLARLRDSHRGGEAITIVEVLYFRTLLRFASVPIGDQVAQLSRLLSRFAHSIRDPAVARQLALKRYPALPTEGVPRDPKLDRLPDDQFASPRAIDWMRRSRLAVVAYPDTTFIEALAMNVPTIGLWDPGLWEIRDDAAPYFERLTELGVVYSDPARAAATIERVYADAGGWWSSSEIQEARLAFLERFGLSGEWLAPWAELLRELAADDPADERV